MAPKLPLPRGWKRRVRSSVLHILALGHYHLLEQRTFARRTWPTSPPLWRPRVPRGGSKEQPSRTSSEPACRPRVHAGWPSTPQAEASCRPGRGNVSPRGSESRSPAARRRCAQRPSSPSWRPWSPRSMHCGSRSPEDLPEGPGGPDSIRLTRYGPCGGARQ